MGTSEPLEKGGKWHNILQEGNTEQPNCKWPSVSSIWHGVHNRFFYGLAPHKYLDRFPVVYAQPQTKNQRE